MGTTLLLADDSITIQKVVGIIFANEDYELVVVDNGNSALEKAREIHPDVMLVDAVMPGKSGYEVCEEVRRDPLLKEIPLLLLVGAFESFDEEKARKSGADDHITKPFESQNLIDKVKALVDHAASRAVKVFPVQEDAPLSSVADSSEKIAAEISSASAVSPGAEMSPEQVGTSAAKPFDSFSGFVHLGEDAAEQSAVAETVSTPLEVLETATVVEPEGVILLSSVDIVEATPEDDPWGTFTEAVEEGDEIHFGEVLEESAEVQLDTSDTVEEIEPFTLMDDESTAGSFGSISLKEESDFSTEMAVSLGEDLDVANETGADEEPGSVEEIPVLSPSDSCSISLGDFSPVHEPVALVEPASPERQEEQPAALFGFSSDYTDLPFAQEEEYQPAAEIFPAAEDEPLPPPASGAEGVVTFSEEQLTAAISKISREILEKIAWEVVPDLAETLIKEEIRKIKESLGR